MATALSFAAEYILASIDCAPEFESRDHVYQFHACLAKDTRGDPQQNSAANNIPRHGSFLLGLNLGVSQARHRC
jgi:hypothetical protein